MTIAEFRQKRKKAGVCRDCGKEDAYTMAGRTYCADCAEKYRIAEAKRRENTERNHRMNDGKRALYAKRKEDGICPSCGLRRAEPGYIQCLHCITKKRNYKREHKLTPPRGEYGICWTCNKRESIPGKRLCHACYEQAVKRCAENANIVSEKRRQYRTLRETAKETI